MVSVSSTGAPSEEKAASRRCNAKESSLEAVSEAKIASRPHHAEKTSLKTLTENNAHTPLRKTLFRFSHTPYDTCEAIRSIDTVISANGNDG
jgi:hypothetical protein